MIAPSPSARRAFTLIELLVVIAILAILMTLLFPAVQGAFDSVKKTQAKNDATQLATAVTAYLSEYGKMPIAAGADQDINTADLMNLLSGKNVDNGNPRQMVFLEVPRSKAGKSGADSTGADYTSPFRDPYGNGQVYKIMVDGDYDNKVQGPDGTDIRKTVIVWSTGKPKGTAPNTDPTKFVKSWE